MPSAPPKPWFRQLTGAHVRALFAAWIGYLLDGFDFVLLTYVLSDVSAEFDVSLATASTLLVATFGSRWLGGFVFGSLGDRYGRKSAMVWSIVLYSGGTFLCGLAWSFAALFAFRLVVGIGMAGEYGASSTYAVESWPAHLKNKASAFLITGFAVGGLVAAQVYSPVVDRFGWRALFFLGILPVLAAVYVRKSAPESPEWEAAAREQGHVQGVSALSLFTRRRLPVTLTLILVVFLAFCTNWPVSGLMPSYLDSLGYDRGTTGDIMFYAGLGTVLGTAASGFVGDRFGTARTYASVLAVSLVFLFPVFAVGAGRPLALVLLLFCFMGTNFGISGLLPKYLYDYFDARTRASGLGTVYNIGAVGGGVAPWWGAVLGDSVGLGTAMAVLTAVGVIALVLLVSFDVPGRLLRRQARRHPHVAELTAAPAAAGDPAAVRGGRRQEVASVHD
ncbi:MFS transporter [Streptomyces sp. NPDC057694]|uniref:MFS transporter n=1 Tax=Streptomyces sp. NPDC057694 TaxID=3346216 RepID=UPI0036870FE1